MTLSSRFTPAAMCTDRRAAIVVERGVIATGVGYAPKDGGNKQGVVDGQH